MMTDNRPFIISKDGVFSMREDAWNKTTKARSADTNKIIPIKPLGSKKSADRTNESATEKPRQANTCISIG
ncbi:MAG: hypothetical protein H8E73_06520 [Planctomycetes bacterium]|nr:hypothetical protein [Planctomycetota bacterium]